MENPFELILDRLNTIEKLIRTTIKNEEVENKGKTLEIFNISQAADFLSLSKSTIYGKTSTREIPHFKRGNRLYFKKSELEDWLT